MHTGANKERNSNWTESTTRDTLLSRAASPPDSQTGWIVSRVMTLAWDSGKGEYIEIVTMEKHTK